MNFNKLTYLSLLTSLFILSSIDYAKACSCGNHPPFFEIVKTVDFIAIIEVSGYDTYIDHRTWEYKNKGEEIDGDMVIPVSMNANINKTFYGDEIRNNILIWGDNGVMCRPYVEVFKPGSEWVVALKKGDPEWGHPIETSEDYYIHSCGEYHLEIVDDNVLGAIENEYEVKVINEEKYEFELIGEEMEINTFIEKLTLLISNQLNH